MAELSEKRVKFIQNVASNPNASQAAKNIAAKYARTAGTTVEAVSAAPKITTTTRATQATPVKIPTGPSITPKAPTGVATPGTARDIAKPSVETQIVEQKITTPKAPTPTAAPTPAPQQFPTGTQGLRATAEGYGLPVGFDATTGQVSIGGKAVDVSGLQRDAQGSYFGTPEQIRSIINQAGTPPSGYTSLRDAFAGSDVQWTPQTGVTIDGMSLDTANLPMVGNQFYLTDQQTENLKQQIAAQKEAMKTPLERTREEMDAAQRKAQEEIDAIIQQRDEAQRALEEERKKSVETLKTYESPLRNEIISGLRQVFGDPFQYDPNADRALQQAQSYAERQLMEQLNARGILSSTITRDQYASLLNEMVPKYESIAFERYNQNIDNLLKKSNILMQLTQDDYQRYKDYVTQSINGIDEVSKNTVQTAKDNLDAINKALTSKLQAEKDAYDMRLKEIDNAYKRLDQLGAVDNETSKLLQIPVGTPSADVRKELLKQKIEIEKSIRDLKDKKELANYETKLNKEEFDYEYQRKQPFEEKKFALEQSKAEEARRANLARESLAAQSEARQQSEAALRAREKQQEGASRITKGDLLNQIQNTYMTEENGVFTMTPQARKEALDYLKNAADSGVSESVITDVMITLGYPIK